jgi:hypothetical protein
MKVDILSLFAEHCSFFYYDPSSIWRMVFDFRKSLDIIDQYEETFYLASSGR